MVNTSLTEVSDLNKAEVELFHPLQYLDAAYFTLRDYFDCFLRGASCGLIVHAPLILLSIFSPALLIGFSPCIAVMSCLLGAVFSAVCHSFKNAYSEQVSTRGIEAFLAYEDVKLSQAEAYELCLAATMQIRSALLLRSIEGQRFCVRVKAVPDRTVVVRLEQIGRGQTRIAVDCVKHWSPLKARLIRQLFGRKFEQLFMRVDDGLNAELIQSVVSAVRETPNWDYRYEGFKPQHSLVAAGR